MGTFWQDLRFGARVLARAPGFTAVVVLTLALAFVANGVIFSFVDAILLRPLPVRNPGQLVRVFTKTNTSREQDAEGNSSYLDYLDARKQSTTFAGLAVYERRGAVLVGEDERILLAANEVSGNYFDLLGVKAQVGRFFTEDEVQGADAQRLVVISYGLWRRRFGGDPQIAGKQIRLASGMFTIAGVAPREFRGLDLWFSPDIWMPITIWPGARDEVSDRSERSLEMIGYISPASKLSEGQAELETIGKQLAIAYPKTNADRTLTALLEVKSRETFGPALLGSILFVLAGMILLIATANVAGLLLVRAERRHKEIAVRIALGAGRSRLIRQGLTEGLLLAALGAAAASVLALWIIGLIPGLMPTMEIPLGFDFRFDARVFGHTLGISLIAILLFGLVPALRASNVDLTEDLRERSSPFGHRTMRVSFRDIVVTAQVGAALMLLIVAGLLVRTTWKAQSMDPGFDTKQNMLLLDISPGLWGYSNEKTRQLYSQLLMKTEALPGVERASLVQRVPLSPSGGGATKIIFVPGMDLAAGESGVAFHYTITGPKYFETMRTRILRGRAFTDQDAVSGPGVALVNETFARRYWPGRDAIGQHMLVGGRQGRDTEIIGVVQDGKYMNITEAPDPYLFLPLSQMMTNDLTLLVKTAGDPGRLIPTIRGGLRAVDKNISAITVLTLAEHMRFALYSQRIVATLVGVLGLLGLFLATVGLYGVVSYSMNRRIHEFGVRMALGAEPRDILRLVLGRGLRLALAGAAIGLVTAFAATRVLAGLLYGVSATDPLTFVGVALLLIFILLLASYIPARRATRVDPVGALRCE
jgi:predicted permease